jgi:tryptophan synthase alpha subunit
MLYQQTKANDKRKRIKYVETQLKEIESSHQTKINMIYIQEKLKYEIDDYYENCKGAFISLFFSV